MLCYDQYMYLRTSAAASATRTTCADDSSLRGDDFVMLSADHSATSQCDSDSAKVWLIAYCAARWSYNHTITKEFRVSAVAAAPRGKYGIAVTTPEY
jgi:hypothetical protein